MAVSSLRLVFGIFCWRTSMDSMDFVLFELGIANANIVKKMLDVLKSALAFLVHASIRNGSIPRYTVSRHVYLLNKHFHTVTLSIHKIIPNEQNIPRETHIDDARNSTATCLVGVVFVHLHIFLHLSTNVELWVQTIDVIDMSQICNSLIPSWDNKHTPPKTNMDTQTPHKFIFFQNTIFVGPCLFSEVYISMLWYKNIYMHIYKYEYIYIYPSQVEPLWFEGLDLLLSKTLVTFHLGW